MCMKMKNIIGKSVYILFIKQLGIVYMLPTYHKVAGILECSYIIVGLLLSDLAMQM